MFMMGQNLRPFLGQTLLERLRNDQLCSSIHICMNKYLCMSTYVGTFNNDWKIENTEFFVHVTILFIMDIIKLSVSL